MERTYIAMLGAIDNNTATVTIVCIVDKKYKDLGIKFI